MTENLVQNEPGELEPDEPAAGAAPLPWQPKTPEQIAAEDAAATAKRRAEREAANQRSREHLAKDPNAPLWNLSEDVAAEERKKRGVPEAHDQMRQFMSRVDRANAQRGASGAQPGAQTYQPTPLKLKWFHDLALQRDDVTLVPNLLEKGTFGILVGKPGTSKTFIALDMALHLAAGNVWFGRDLAQGGVVYVAAEAGERIVNRVIAYKQHHYGDDAPELPFAVVTTAVDLYARPDGGSTQELIGQIKAATFPAGLAGPALIIIDTLSRAMPGGDENSPQDMTAFIGNVDQIRQETGATILAVHHHGKDEARGARGHTSLIGAVDTELTVERDEAAKIYTVKPTKQRDMAAGEPIAYRLHVVELGDDTNGNRLSSCVVEPVDAPPAKSGKSKPLTGYARIGLDMLQKAIADGGRPPVNTNHVPAGVSVVTVKDWRRYFYSGTVRDDDEADPKKAYERQKKAFQAASKELSAVHAIGVWADEVWITGSGK